MNVIQRQLGHANLGVTSIHLRSCHPGRSRSRAPFYDAGDSVLSVTGGTGAYRNARGEMELKYRNPAGTEFDFVFHLIG